MSDPLYGDRPIEDLRMPLPAKALIQARRHLVHDHGLHPASWSSLRVLELHLRAHGLSPGAAGGHAVPFAMVGHVHDAVARQEERRAFLERHEGIGL